MYDHGARNRNPVSTLWYGIDPLFEKYPDFSPYNYCAGNPVRLVDLDGRELIIKDDGESFVYDPTIGENTYYGDNRMIRGSVNALNMMNSTEAGHSLLKDFHSSNSIYTITNGNATVKSGASTIATYNQLGIINGTLLNANNYYEDIEVIAHELFHSYQYEKKQGGASIFNEIEAYIYQNIVLKQYNVYNNFDLELFLNSDLSFTRATEQYEGTEIGMRFQRTFEDLLYKSFSDSNFVYVMNNFRELSSANSDCIYDKSHYTFRLETNKEILIRRFLP